MRGRPLSAAVRVLVSGFAATTVASAMPSARPSGGSAVSPVDGSDGAVAVGGSPAPAVAPAGARVSSVPAVAAGSVRGFSVPAVASAGAGDSSVPAVEAASLLGFGASAGAAGGGEAEPDFSAAADSVPGAGGSGGMR